MQGQVKPLNMKDSSHNITLITKWVSEHIPIRRKELTTSAEILGVFMNPMNKLGAEYKNGNGAEL